MDALDAERACRALDGVRQMSGIAGADFLGRTAMPWQIQCDHPPSLRQSRLGEHPGIEVGAKAVQQQDRDTVAFAELEIAQAQASGLQFARLYGIGVYC